LLIAEKEKMATTAKIAKTNKKPKFSTRTATAAASADGRAPTCASSASAACASAAWH